MSTKRILSLVLAITLILGTFSLSFAAPAATTDAKIDELVKLNFIKGVDDGGDLALDRKVLRGEVATIVSRAEESKNYPGETVEKLEAAIKKNFTFISRFRDVKIDDWANPFVNYASQEGYIVGMPDYVNQAGHVFKAESNISYQEILTIMVRLLGEKKLEGTWPNNYTLRAQELGLLEGLDKVSDYSEIPTREEVLVIFYNTLYRLGRVGEADVAIKSVSAVVDKEMITVGAETENAVGKTAKITLTKAGMEDLAFDITVSETGIISKIVGPVDAGTYTVTVAIGDVVKTTTAVVEEEVAKDAITVTATDTATGVGKVLTVEKTGYEKAVKYLLKDTDDEALNAEPIEFSKGTITLFQKVGDTVTVELYGEDGKIIDAIAVVIK